MSDIQVNEYLVCVNDKSDKKYRNIIVSTTDEEKEFYGSFKDVLNGEVCYPRDYKVEKTNKLSTLTFGKLYKVIDIDKKGGSVKILGDNGRMIWIDSKRFDYIPEVSRNKIREDRLIDMLDS